MREGGSWFGRHEHWKEFSEGQVNLLRDLRRELSSRRWEIMLDVDSAQNLTKLALSVSSEKELTDILDRIARLLDDVHQGLGRIPEDFIPAF
jgi:hypothetical protein